MQANTTLKTFFVADLDCSPHQHASNAFELGLSHNFKAIPRCRFEIVDVRQVLSGLVGQAGNTGRVNLHKTLELPVARECQGPKGKKALDTFGLLPPIPMGALRPISSWSALIDKLLQPTQKHWHPCRIDGLQVSFCDRFDQLGRNKGSRKLVKEYYRVRSQVRAPSALLFPSWHRPRRIAFRLVAGEHQPVDTA